MSKTWVPITWKNINRRIAELISTAINALVIPDEYVPPEPTEFIIPIVEALPEADATKAGTSFWYNNSLYVYARTGQFTGKVEGDVVKILEYTPPS